MPRDTPQQRRQARLIDNLKRAELALLEAKVEVSGREDKQARAVRNALTATQYAIKPPTSVLSSEPVSDDPSGADK